MIKIDIVTEKDIVGEIRELTDYTLMGCDMAAKDYTPTERRLMLRVAKGHLNEALNRIEMLLGEA